MERVLLGRKPLGKFKSCLQLWRPEKYQSHRETQLVQIHQEIRRYLGDETLLDHSNNNEPVSFEQRSPQEPVPNQITNQMTPPLILQRETMVTPESTSKKKMLDWTKKLKDAIKEFIALTNGKCVSPSDEYIQDLTQKVHSMIESTLYDKPRKEDAGVSNNKTESIHTTHQ